MWKVILTELEENEPKAPSFKVTKKGVKKKELICEDPHLLTSRFENNSIKLSLKIKYFVNRAFYPYK